jgi:hypothetical protein
MILSSPEGVTSKLSLQNNFLVFKYMLLGITQLNT